MDEALTLIKSAIIFSQHTKLKVFAFMDLETMSQFNSKVISRFILGMFFWSLTFFFRSQSWSKTQNQFIQILSMKYFLPNFLQTLMEWLHGWISLNRAHFKDCSFQWVPNQHIFLFVQSRNYVLVLSLCPSDNTITFFKHNQMTSCFVHMLFN
jgi:hypothetical protein